MKDIFQKASQKTCIADGSSFNYTAESKECVRISHLPDRCKDTNDQALKLMQSFHKSDINLFISYSYFRSWTIATYLAHN